MHFQMTSSSFRNANPFCRFWQFPDDDDVSREFSLVQSPMFFEIYNKDPKDSSHYPFLFFCCNEKEKPSPSSSTRKRTSLAATLLFRHKAFHLLTRQNAVTMKVSLIIPFVIPSFVAGFSLPVGYSYSTRRTLALAYHDDDNVCQGDSPTVSRAKDCIEHFGECSIQELQDLQSSKWTFAIQNWTWLFLSGL